MSRIRRRDGKRREGGIPSGRARPPRAMLRRLRFELSAVFALVAVVGVAVFAYVLVRVDLGDRRDRQVSDLHGTASRAAALMYQQGGRTHTDAVADDTVAERPSRLVVFSGTDLTLVFRSAAARGLDAAALHGLARAALRDAAEHGTVADVDGLRAVALPWFGANSRPAGAVIALAPAPTASGGPLLVPVGIGAAVLLVVLILAGWILTGRSIRPAVSAIADREAFLATAAHELRTPLARLRAGAETVQRAARHDEAQGAALASLVTMADSAAHVVANLLLAARIDHAGVPLATEAVRLDQVAADAEHLDPAVVAVVTEPITVDADPHLLRHALTNLVDNALRHAKLDRDDPLVLVTAEVRGDRAALRVTDNGPGFPAGTDPVAAFATASVGGTGLGLSLVAWIAQAHGATLDLRNLPGPETGAEVELVLPAGPAAKSLK